MTPNQIFHMYDNALRQHCVINVYEVSDEKRVMRVRVSPVC